MKNKIETFRGDYHFLSNFYEHEPIVMDGLSFNSVEAAFQAQKSENPLEKHRFQFMDPKESKAEGKKVNPLRPDWNDVRIQVMKDALRLKFAIPKLRKRLLETADAELIESNNWCDAFWGRCDCFKHGSIGENHLGKLLMKIRAELQKEAENEFS